MKIVFINIFTFLSVILLFFNSCSSTAEDVDISKLNELDNISNPPVLLKVRLGHSIEDFYKKLEENGAYKHTLKFKGYEEVPDGYAYKPYSDYLIGRLTPYYTTIEGEDVLTKFSCSYYNKTLNLIPRLLANSPGKPWNNMIIDLNDYSEDEIPGMLENDIYKLHKFPCLNKDDVQKLCNSFIEKYGKTSSNKNAEKSSAFHAKYSNGMYRYLKWNIGYIVVEARIDDFCPDTEFDSDNCGYNTGGYSFDVTYSFTNDIQSKIYSLIERKSNKEKQDQLNTNF